MTRLVRWPVWLEIAVFAAVWCGVIAILGAGDANGIGYFQAPENNLYWPLAIGGAFNFAQFVWLVWYALPAWQERRSVRVFILAAILIIVVNVILQTLVQISIIAWREPSLAEVGILPLALENLHAAIGLPLWCLLYRGIRDWFTQRQSPTQEPATAPRIAFGSAANPVLLDPADIRVIGAQGNYIEIDLGETRRQVQGSLTGAADRLPAGRFIRVHRSWLVNLDHVERMTRTSARVGGKDVPVGERYAATAMAAWRATIARPDITHSDPV